MSKLKKTTVCVQGMHCASCDILVKNQFQKIDNIQSVQADHHTQTAEITYTGDLNKAELNQKIAQFGYTVVEPQAFVQERKESLAKRLFDAGAIAMILFMLFVVAQEFSLIPSFQSSSLTFTTVFILGLVASTSTCMATSGAMFLATIGKLNSTQGVSTEKQSVMHNFMPALMFNVGRVGAYTVGGFLIGMVGQAVSGNAQFGSMLSLGVAFMMILIGLDMLKLISLSSILPNSLNKGLFEKLEHKFSQNPRGTAIFMGAITYFLPCGFTQTVQVYALGLADPVKSAAMMAIFAIGTMPALLAIGFASSFTKSALYPMFSKVMGMVVFVIGISYVSNALTLYGVKIPVISSLNSTLAGDATVAQEQGDFQVIRMTVDYGGYKPASFTVKQNKPVRWEIEGKNVFGCQGALVSSKLNINTTLKVGENVFEFTPTEKGDIPFSCSMGMFAGIITVI
jgi:uncharacterized protein